MDFFEWLETEKGLSRKSSGDVISRLKRVQFILGEKDISDTEINRLEKEENFRILSRTVRSQLRRSVRLYTEFKNKSL